MGKLHSLTKEKLIDLYINEKKSLDDIATIYNTSRTAIYRQKTKNGWSYMFIYDHKNSVKLFNILYKNVQNRLYLDRKYKRFLEGLRETLTER